MDTSGGVQQSDLDFDIFGDQQKAGGLDDDSLVSSADKEGGLEIDQDYSE